jgi:CTP synthase
VITAKDVESIYEVPIVFHQEGLDERIVEMLNIWTRKPRLEAWIELNESIQHPRFSTNIAIVGKYVHLKDSYKSLNEALAHGGIANNATANLMYTDAEEVEKKGADQILKDADGILVPGGFGERGIEGKIEAIRYAREKKIPFFGICLGMQLAVVEFARQVCHLKGAHSTEFNQDTSYPVIYHMKEWINYENNTVVKRDEDSHKGGTMRLGVYPCTLEEGSFALRAYGKKLVSERHRHRYEFNNQFRDRLSKAGLKISGTSPDGRLVEIVEIRPHPWFLGCQCHPEFKSKPMDPHPLFRDFIKAALEKKKQAAPKKKGKKGFSP